MHHELQKRRESEILRNFFCLYFLWGFSPFFEYFRDEIDHGGSAFLGALDHFLVVDINDDVIGRFALVGYKGHRETLYAAVPGCHH